MWTTARGARRIGLGAMRLSTDPARDDDRAIGVLHAALDAGVTFLDTADVYCRDDRDIGHNERLIARALAMWRSRTRDAADADAVEVAREPGDGASRTALDAGASGTSVHATAGGARQGRSDVLIATKGGLTRPQGAWRADGRARHLAAACEASLRALGVDRLALYQLHAVDPRTPLETSMRALAGLQREGLIGAIGLSNVTVGQIEEARRIAEIVSVQNALSAWHDDSVLNGVLDYCDAHGLAFIAYSPLGGGGAQARRRITDDPVLREIAARHDATHAEIALAWLRTLGRLVIPIPGASRVETAQSAARAAAIVLTDADRERLDARFPSGRASRFRARARRLAPPAPSPEPPDSLAADASRKPHESRVADAACNTDSSHEPHSTHGMDGDTRPAGAAHLVGDSAEAAREVVLIMGLPAAGKSTLAESFVAQGYERLNRDEAGGSLHGLLPVLDRRLAAGAARVVLDNTYVSRAARAGVIQTAWRHGVRVRCVSLATSVEEAQVNAVQRMLARHGRLLAADELPKGKARDVSAFGPSVQFRYQRELEPPSLAEGFAQIDVVPFERHRDPSFTGRALLIWCDAVLWRSRAGHRTPASSDDVLAIEAGRRGAILRGYAAAGWHVLGLSWQPEIAARQRAAPDVAAAIAQLQAMLDVAIAIDYCPHAAGPPICWCRKPLPGLGVRAIERHRLDPAQCLYIGAGPQDPGFARRLGMPYRAADAFFMA